MNLEQVLGVVLIVTKNKQKKLDTFLSKIFCFKTKLVTWSEILSGSTQTNANADANILMRSLKWQRGVWMTGRGRGHAEARSPQGSTASLGFWKTLVVPVQSQVLHSHQFTCQTTGRAAQH